MIEMKGEKVEFGINLGSISDAFGKIWDFLDFYST